MKILLGVLGICFYSLLFYSCERTKLDANTIKRYYQYKNYFDKEYTSFFPENVDNVQTKTFTILSKRDTSNNNTALILYEYGITNKLLLEVLENAQKTSIAQYNTKDTCLLVVNRFETRESNELAKPAIITDSSSINRSCYDGKLPIPNFIDYGGYNPNRVGILDSSFTIYVFESKAFTSWGNSIYKMQPNPQMPDNWKNGYSKGVAISKSKNIIIYWLVMW